MSGKKTHRCTCYGYVEGVLDRKESPEIIIYIRDVFVGDKNPTYVKPGHHLVLKREDTCFTYKYLMLGDRIDLDLAYSNEDQKYFVVIEGARVTTKATRPLLPRDKPQYAATGSLPHQVVRTVNHRYMELTVPDEAPAPPPTELHDKKQKLGDPSIH